MSQQQSTSSDMPVKKAADMIGVDAHYFRLVVRRLQAARYNERGRMVVPSQLVEAFRLSKAATGYLHPRNATLADILNMAPTASAPVAPTMGAAAA